MHPDLASLLALQEKDRAVTAVEKALAALLPEEVALDKELGAHAKAMDDAHKGAAAAQARRTELELRIASYKSQQDRRKQQLDFVRGAKEASTLMAEIDMARGVLVKEESDFLRSGDAIVEADKKVKDVAKLHEAVVTAQAEARAALAERRAALAGEFEQARAQRSAAAREVAAAALVRYERIRRGRSPQALYPVRADACGHCFTAVPLQRRVQIQQGQTMEMCEACGVLLYADG